MVTTVSLTLTTHRRCHRPEPNPPRNVPPPSYPPPGGLRRVSVNSALAPSGGFEYVPQSPTYSPISPPRLTPESPSARSAWLSAVAAQDLPPTIPLERYPWDIVWGDPRLMATPQEQGYGYFFSAPLINAPQPPHRHVPRRFNDASQLEPRRLNFSNPSPSPRPYPITLTANRITHTMPSLGVGWEKDEWEEDGFSHALTPCRSYTFRSKRPKDIFIGHLKVEGLWPMMIFVDKDKLYELGFKLKSNNIIGPIDPGKMIVVSIKITPRSKRSCTLGVGEVIARAVLMGGLHCQIKRLIVNDPTLFPRPTPTSTISKRTKSKVLDFNGIAARVSKTRHNKER